MGVISSDVSFVRFLGWLVKEVVLLNQFLQLVRGKKANPKNISSYSYNICKNYIQANYLLCGLQWHLLFTSEKLPLDGWVHIHISDWFYKQTEGQKSLKLNYKASAIWKFTQILNWVVPNKLVQKEYTTAAALWRHVYSELTDCNSILLSKTSKLHHPM